MNIIDDDNLIRKRGKWCLNGKPYTGIGKSDYGTYYYKNGNFHRDNGLPAYEGENGDKAWYVNGNFIRSWEQYQKETNCSKEQLVMYILTHGNICV